MKHSASSGSGVGGDKAACCWDRLMADGVLEGLVLPWGVSGARLITGHASERRFYRLHAENQTTAVLIVYPQTVSSELRRCVRATEWFAAADARVPEILAVGSKTLLVEDGGTLHLDELPRDVASRRRVYGQAVDLIVKLQRFDTVPPPNPDWALDAARLRQELEFAELHALRGWMGSSAGAVARARGFDHLADVVAGLPTALCHRDFHARNLLVRQDSLLVLDFQDAMRGPFLYDLASLLWDNYCDVPPEVQEAAICRFWRASRHRFPARRGNSSSPSLPAGLPAGYRRAFCLVALQRSLKALGTFGYQVSVLGRQGYRSFAARTWQHTRRALRALRWDELETALGDLRQLERCRSRSPKGSGGEVE